jgi:hypothetical protein
LLVRLHRGGSDRVGPARQPPPNRPRRGSQRGCPSAATRRPPAGHGHQSADRRSRPR